MRVEIVRSLNGDTWSLGLVGVRSERFRNVTLTAADLRTLKIQSRLVRMRAIATFRVLAFRRMRSESRTNSIPISGFRFLASIRSLISSKPFTTIC
jgi:hypothetical protein